MICKHCHQPMYCLKTWRDTRTNKEASGNVKALFTCECEGFKETAISVSEAIDKFGCRMQ